MTRRNCYPAAPLVGWKAPAVERAARRAFIDRRNRDIQASGAQRALDAAKGGTIGTGKA